MSSGKVVIRMTTYKIAFLDRCPSLSLCENFLSCQTRLITFPGPGGTECACLYGPEAQCVCVFVWSKGTVCVFLCTVQRHSVCVCVCMYGPEA